MPGSRGEANLVMKCKFCRRDLSLDIVAEHREASLNEDSTTVQPLATFEGRGLEVVAFIPKVLPRHLLFILLLIGIAGRIRRKGHGFGPRV